jgi:hypothetical protein
MNPHVQLTAATAYGTSRKNLGPSAASKTAQTCRNTALRPIPAQMVTHPTAAEQAFQRSPAGPPAA